MIFIRPLLLLPICVVFSILVSCEVFYSIDDSNEFPIVVISVLVRNKELTLPYFLSSLRRLEYPKERLYLWIYSDYTIDSSERILGEWVANHRNEYGVIYVTMNSTYTGFGYPDEYQVGEWTPENMEHVIELREKALNFGRKLEADYLLMIDADVYLTNPESLTRLIRKNVEICAPMLQTDGYYSNFWCAMTEKYYYKRTEDYPQILFRENTGCFSVPMVHTCVLINLKSRKSKFLTYDSKKALGYDGPRDDIITFAVNAKNIGMNLYICNDIKYGSTQTPSTRDKDYIESERQHLLNLKMEYISSGEPLPLDNELERYVQYPTPSNYRLHDIYVLNLERRPERRRLMEMSLKELGMKFTFFNAIDSQELTPQVLFNLDIHVLPNYEDPYHKRPIKLGEIGCFLSHYYIWSKVADERNRIVMVLEDDIRFVPNFQKEFNELMDDLEKPVMWDFVYIGRKILHDEELSETKHIVRPRYSYWTLGYILTSRGAQKLIDEDPLKKLLPVDEYIPLMFDDHPNTTWKSYFKNRNLVALSASPLLVYPTHFTGQEGYISDTEESTIHDKVGSDDDEMDMTLIRNDPLRIKERFVMPSIYNESVYKIEEEYKLYKTEL